jgi:hypothetical protein
VHGPHQAREMPFVVMLIKFGAFDEGSARLNDAAHIAARGEQLACNMNRSIAGSGRTRPWQLTWLSENNMPHHLVVWLQVCSCFVCIGKPAGSKWDSAAKRTPGRAVATVLHCGGYTTRKDFGPERPRSAPLRRGGLLCCTTTRAAHLTPSQMTGRRSGSEPSFPARP